MERNALGRLDVSAVGLGCNNFGGRIDEAQTLVVVDAALDAGINYFDTAEAYSDGKSEELLGKALAGRRGEAVIATKWGHTMTLAEGERGGDPALIRSHLEASLRRLGTDHIDHYQLHRPDPETPPAETLGCLAELRDEGKILEYGCTHFTAAELDESAAAADSIGVDGYPSVQNHYSVLTRGPEMDGVFEACERLGTAFVPYFPLESGLLTGKYRLGEEFPEGTRLANSKRSDAFVDEQRLAVVERLIEWCADHDHSLLDLAISWHTSHPLVASVIAGATRPEQVAANVAAAGWCLSVDDRSEVDEIVSPVVRERLD